MPIQTLRVLLGELGTLAFVAGGLVLMIGGTSFGSRRYARQLLLLGVVCSLVAGLVRQNWLP